VNPSASTRTIAWVCVFALAFAFVESSVVAYLRALYYPAGFAFPLRSLEKGHIAIEVAREAATLVMLAVTGIIAGSGSWERFAYFLIAFGVWDIFYYVWLKVILNWPLHLTDWDILFLIPLPWIGPVIAPVMIAACMTVCGMLIVIRLERGDHFRPLLLSWILGLSASLIALYSFVSDLPAALQGQAPQPYRYELLFASLVLYGAGFVAACKPPTSRIHHP